MNCGASAPRSEARRILTQDAAVQRVLAMADRVASHRVPVLIQGETGTGKELVARYLHEQGRRGKPFVAVNCAAIPKELAESLLFGHERGAFTGAVGSQRGKFELAHGGTLLLDEMADLDLGLQAKLLRALEEGEVDRVGGQAPVPVNVRVIATAQAQLADKVAAGTFRADLYYRLAVVVLELPPLRERPGDVTLIANHLVQEHGKRLTPEAREWLGKQPWPGNVRQLVHAMERAGIFTDGPTIDVEDLCEAPDASPVWKVPPAMSLADMRRGAILAALNRTGGNRTQAAKALGVCIRTLRNRLKEYNIPPGAGRPSAPIPLLPTKLGLLGEMQILRDRKIAAALQATNGNQKAAAKLLGMNRTTLHEALRSQRRRTAQHQSG